jgi:hypothetical protein
MLEGKIPPDKRAAVVKNWVEKFFICRMVINL